MSVRSRRVEVYGPLFGVAAVVAAGAEPHVLSGGRPVGRFVLSRTPGGTLSLEQRVVAVAPADQAGAVLGIDQDRRHRSNG